MGTLGLPPYNPLGALPQTPLRGLPLRLPSPLRGGFKLPGWNQVSLRFLILIFVRFALENGGTMGLPPPIPPLGALPQTPLRGFPLRLPSPLRGGFKQLERNQVSLRFLILVLFRFALDNRVTMGLPPHAPLGALPQTPLRGFPLRLPSSLRGGFKKCLQKQRTAAPF